MAESLKFKREEQVHLGQVNGDVELIDCQVVIPKDGPEIDIKGTLRIRGRTLIKGSLKCGRLETDCRDEIEIEGDLSVVTSAQVDRGGLLVNGSAQANRFDVDSSLRVGKNLECKSVNCGGALTVKGDAKVERVDVGGAIKVEGTINVEELDVGGAISCNTGTIKCVDVGGAFKATGAMEIDNLDVGGAAVVGPGSKILSVDIGGSFKSLGDLTFERIDVGGMVKIEGDAKGESLDSGGVLKVEGSLTLAGELKVGGVVKIGRDFQANESIRVGGTLKVEGTIDSPTIDIGGSIKASHIKAEKEFRIGRRGEVQGFVEGGRILIRERARGESFYGESIRAEENARVKNLYGWDIYLERGVTVEGDLLYVSTLEMEKDIHLRKEPQKVDKLPPPEKLRI
ncbi:MAG: hypothetical protein ACFFDP_00240 [Promethearchaeota archaeon]